MTKYFCAEVTLQKVVKVSVAAESEIEARRKASDLARQKTAPDFNVSKVLLRPDGETEYGVGIRVKHYLFGIGKITTLERSMSGAGERGFLAQIEFESGKVAHFGLPMSKERLQVLT